MSGRKPGPGAPGRARPWSTRTTFLSVVGCLVLAAGASWSSGPAGTVAHALAGQGLEALAVVVTVVMAARRRRALGAVGWLLAGATGFALLGDAGWLLRTLVEQHTASGAAAAGLLVTPYALGYGLLLGAGFELMRRRSGWRGPGALIDSAVITVGLGVVAYCFVIADQLADSTAPLPDRLVSGIGPGLDVVVVGVLTRLLIGARSGRSPLVLLLAAMSSYLLGDLAFAVSLLLGVAGTWNSWVDLLFALFYLFTALALVHPDADRLCRRAGAEVERLGAARAGALALAGLLAPATLLAEHFLRRDPHVVAVAVAGAVLFGLTLLRMLLLVRAIESQRAQLAVQARTDALTGLANRRTYDHELQRALAAATGTPVSAGMIDLDHFKAYNDTHGHAAGDELLRTAAAAWSAELARALPAGRIARYGGEEFAVLLPGLTSPQAAQVVSRLLAVTPSGQTFSAGVAGWDGSVAAERLLREADEQLYRAKGAGRARVLC
ncbi:GGDEF domain-containing protein [Kineococcus sp. SYSU DK001]|uniref:GGDEF domain-containing protein n=1 Tax=Kineococcus sp. SYSU DK001 TaxID=3383122 RepID=UPI003D7D1CC5